MDNQGKKGFYAKGAQMKALMGDLKAGKLMKAKQASERHEPVSKGPVPMKGMKSMKKGKL